MIQNNVEMLILVKGRPVTEYLHNGQIYVEGREASEYEIEFRNPNPFRVEAVLSVDGLSVLDGKEAGPASRGYIVPAHGTIRIPGWKLDDATVARFEFGGKRSSYAAQTSGGNTRNTGVIGALVYKERPVQTSYWRGPITTCGPMPSGGPFYGSSVRAAAMSKGMSSGNVGVSDNLWAMGIGANAASLNESVAISNTADAQAYSTSVVGTPVVQQELGTGFGSAADFRTRMEDFQRADLLVMLVLYYDSARGLKARGIEIVRRSRAIRTNEPDPFPGMPKGCVPPPGWKG